MQAFPLWQVVRVALMGLKNLLADAALDVGPEAVEAGLPKVVQQRLLQVHAPSRSTPSVVAVCPTQVLALSWENGALMQDDSHYPLRYMNDRANLMPTTVTCLPRKATCGIIGCVGKGP